ncbi:unnamed protein product [Blepharisma stoltei]|uniref:Uncharacterized protein n=1 Tax=Blepharisma stoltei TaxID=1481888 RepID=A0AAU9KC46_9CILI|nr:unnamed protein product [Blepharisma stoltei]
MEITANFIEEVSTSSTPNVLLIPQIKADIKKSIGNVDNRDCQNELNILSSFYIQLIEFGKNRLFLGFERIVPLLQIGHSLIAASCYQQILGNFPTVEELFTLLTKQIVESRYTPSQKRQIIEFFTETFFKHFRLYTHVFGNKQKSETLYINVSIDSPLPSLPLSMAVQRLKHNEVKQDDNFSLDSISRSASVQKSGRISRPSSRKGSFSSPKNLHKEEEDLNEAVSPFPSESTDPLQTKLDLTVRKYQDSMQEEFEKHQQIIDTHYEEVKKKIGK